MIARRTPEVLYDPYSIMQLAQILKKCNNPDVLRKLQIEELESVCELSWDNYSDSLASQL